MRKKNLTNPQFLTDLVIRRKYNTGLSVLFRQAHMIRKKLMRVWRLKQRQKSIIKNHLKKNISSPEEFFVSSNQNISDENLYNYNKINDKEYENKIANEKNLIAEKEEIEVGEEIEVEAQVEVKEENDETNFIDMDKINKKKSIPLRRIKYKTRGSNFRGLVLNRSDQKHIRLN